MSNRQEGQPDITRTLMAATIASTEFLQGLKNIWRDDLVGSSWRWIAGKCFEYHGKYGSAPGRNIEAIWESATDPEVKTDLERVLSGISDEWEKQPNGLNAEFLLEEARNYFKRELYATASAQIEAATDGGDIERADELLKKLNEDIDRFSSDGRGLERAITTESDFMAQKHLRERAYLEPWLTQASLTQIYGDRGVGKTFLLHSVALALTRNRDRREIPRIGSWRVVQKAGVLLVHGEGSNYEIFERLKRLRGPMGEETDAQRFPLMILTQKNSHDISGRDINLERKADREEIASALERNPRIKVLMLDNVSTLFPTLDENSKEAWGPISMWLVHLKSVLGVAVIFAHHANKSGGQRGTSGREDILDNVIKLEECGRDCDFQVKFQKNRNLLEHETEPFRLRLVPHAENDWLTWEQTEINEKGGNKPDTELRVWEMLIDGHKQSDIAKAVGVGPSRISQIKRKAIDELKLLDESGNPTRKGRDWARRRKEEAA